MSWLGLGRTWPKLAGGKGFHLMAPIDHRVTHDEAHAQAKRIVEQFAATDPTRSSPPPLSQSD